MKRARSVTSDTGVDDDAKSTTSSIGGSRTPARKTPAQVKAEAAARKAKVMIVYTLFFVFIIHKDQYK